MGLFFKKYKGKQQKKQLNIKKEKIYNSDRPKIYTRTYYARK